MSEYTVLLIAVVYIIIGVFIADWLEERGGYAVFLMFLWPAVLMILLPIVGTFCFVDLVWELGDDWSRRHK